MELPCTCLANRLALPYFALWCWVGSPAFALPLPALPLAHIHTHLACLPLPTTYCHAFATCPCPCLAPCLAYPTPVPACTHTPHLAPYLPATCRFWIPGCPYLPHTQDTPTCRLALQTYCLPCLPPCRWEHHPPCAVLPACLTPCPLHTPTPPLYAMPTTTLPYTCLETPHTPCLPLPVPSRLPHLAPAALALPLPPHTG